MSSSVLLTLFPETVSHGTGAHQLARLQTGKPQGSSASSPSNGIIGLCHHAWLSTWGWGAWPHILMFAEQIRHPLSHLQAPKYLTPTTVETQKVYKRRKKILQLFKRKGLQTQPQFYKKKSNQREA